MDIANPQFSGIAVHVDKNLLFISDSSRQVIRKSLSNSNDSGTAILQPSHINFEPQDLSVDWLNNHLYMLGEASFMWQIKRCELDGTRLQVAIAGLRYKPLHIEVDPYNGYEL